MNRTSLALALATTLLATAGAGCLDDLGANGGNGPSGSEAEFGLRGTFTENRTQDDLDAFHALVDAHGAEAVLLETFPEQFEVDHVNRTACASLHGELEQRAFVQDVDDCTLISGSGPDTGDGDDTVTHDPSDSNSATDQDWRVSGAFTGNATQNDTAELDAEVQALGGSLTVMESYPMQYAVTILDEGRCEDVRELLATKAYVDTIGDCHEVERSENPDEPVSDDA